MRLLEYSAKIQQGKNNKNFIVLFVERELEKQKNISYFRRSENAFDWDPRKANN